MKLGTKILLAVLPVTVILFACTIYIGVKYGPSLILRFLPASSPYVIEKNMEKNGGIEVKLVPDSNGVSITPVHVNDAREIIRQRISSKNVNTSVIDVEEKTGIMKIKVAWGAERCLDSEDEMKKLVKVGLLTFQEIDENKRDNNGIYLPTGRIIITGNDIINATSEKDTTREGYCIALRLDRSGSAKFEEATGRLVGKRIAIFIDEKLLVAPIVQTKITGGNIVINGQKDMKESLELSTTIKSGALPFKLRVEDFKVFEKK